MSAFIPLPISLKTQGPEENVMALIERATRTEIWHDTAADEYYAYREARLVRVCPSLGMAREVVA